LGYAEVDELLRDAHTAMYRAKAVGTAAVFGEVMHARAVTVLKRENDPRRDSRCWGLSVR
jgi:hypothetical protein